MLAKEDINHETLRLKSAVEELSILNEIAVAISSTQSLDNITNLIVKKCVKYLNAEQGAIHLIDEKDVENPLHTMIRIQTYKDDPLRFSKQITDHIIINKKPVLINDFKTEEIIPIGRNEILKISSLLSVPMIIKGKIIGILSLYNKCTDDGFNESDQRLLSIIAGQSANVIENARLFIEEQEFIKIQQELKVAGDIQKNILPRSIPKINYYDIYAVNIPASEIGGDYYDFIKIAENKTAIALGDVTGKGLTAAMLMANLQATLRSELLFINGVKDCIARANNLLFESTDPTKFATLFFGILDTEKNILTYCNAGHNEALFYNNGTLVKLSKGGLLLGCLENMSYDEEEIIFEKDSSLIIFSDGITEAMNGDEDCYGDERLEKLIEDKLSLTSNQIAEEIITDVKIFTAGTKQSDDITLMIIKRNN
ncbi:MAG TPA: GAF domain-containing SpoIIE family protein phosphatase [Ignavibacteriaceae bacterium]|nr:GAF domain-containing SpoIIE family protein phosphatase [Ignavibacteriaceae bacterium]